MALRLFFTAGQQFVDSNFYIGQKSVVQKANKICPILVFTVGHKTKGQPLK
tara:strand:+ start:55 stop:207 length:153 start_codon:yes stop_codon:yes gene_type:complete